MCLLPELLGGSPQKALNECVEKVATMQWPLLPELLGGVAQNALMSV